MSAEPGWIRHFVEGILLLMGFVAEKAESFSTLTKIFLYSFITFFIKYRLSGRCGLCPEGSDGKGVSPVPSGSKDSNNSPTVSGWLRAKSLH